MKLSLLIPTTVLSICALVQAAPVEQRCGASFGGQKCPKNLCCSHAGYCGTGKDYCTVPEICQKAFGRCNSDDVPPGPPTSHDKRPMLSKISYGQPITRCTVPGTVALTFDDGPTQNTEQILKVLRGASAKATFFLSGNNNGKGEIDLKYRWREMVQAIDADDHQIASHTWTHADLNGLTSQQRKDEMYRNERAIANIIGRYPTYMRAPYIRCGPDCTKDITALGYHIVNWSVNSGDTETRNNFEAMKRAVDAGIDRVPEGGVIFIQHDTIPLSASRLTQHILNRVKEKKWKPVTVAECLGEPLEEAYRSKLPAEVSIDMN